MSLLQALRSSIRAGRLAKVSRWNPARVNRLAERRFRRLVRFAVRNSPFFREKYRGIDIDRCSLDELPTTTKQEMRDNFDLAVTDHRVKREDVEQFLDDPRNLGRWFLGRYAVSRTSGSQGPPLSIVQDRRCLEILFGIMSARGSVSARPGFIEVLRRWRRPARLAIVAHARGFYPSCAAFEFMSQIVGPGIRSRWLSTAQADLIDSLNDFRPHALLGYPTALESLVRHAERLRFDHLRQIGSSGEQLTPKARERITAAFGVPVLDHYGTGECLWLSTGCATGGGAHVNADWAILEVVDADYRPVPDGQVGEKVLVTNLANLVQPFIRFEIGDRVSMSSHSCNCGSRLPRIDRLDGRVVESFWFSQGDGYAMVPGGLFHAAADALPDLRQWQVSQVARNRIEIRLELLPLAAQQDAAAHFTRAVRALGVPNHVEVDVEIVPALNPDPNTGKFQHVVSRVGRPSAADLAMPAGRI